MFESEIERGFIVETIKHNENSVHLFISNLTLGNELKNYQEILKAHYEDLLRGGNRYKNAIMLKEHSVDGKRCMAVLLDGEKIGDLIGSEVDMYDALKRSGKNLFMQIDIEYSRDYYTGEKFYNPSIYCILS